jgi:hypothetical protein
VSGAIKVKRKTNIADSKVIDPVVGMLVIVSLLIIFYINYFSNDELNLVQKVYNEVIFSPKKEQHPKSRKNAKKSLTLNLDLINHLHPKSHRKKRYSLIILSVIGMSLIVATMGLVATQ